MIGLKSLSELIKLAFLGEMVEETEVSSPPVFRPTRAVGIVSVLSVVVAVLGYLREASLAGRFGVSATMDAYFAAVFIPNTLFTVLIAGTLSPIFIPILLAESGTDDR